jgi:hypothetical protein
MQVVFVLDQQVGDNVLELYLKPFTLQFLSEQKTKLCYILLLSKRF